MKLDDSVLTWRKVSLVIFCSFMIVTAHKHGDVHEWDLSSPEVHQALYVSINV